MLCKLDGNLGANTTAALQYMDQRLTGDRSAKVAFIFTNELRDFDAEMEMKARNLVERDVSVSGFRLCVVDARCGAYITCDHTTSIYSVSKLQ